MAKDPIDRFCDDLNDDLETGYDSYEINKEGKVKSEKEKTKEEIKAEKDKVDEEDYDQIRFDFNVDPLWSGPIDSPADIDVSVKIEPDWQHDVNQELADMDIYVGETPLKNIKYSWKKGKLSDLELALTELPGVTGAIFKENYTCEEVDGMPPFSIECIVSGGTDEDIADAILYNRAGGTETFGNTVCDIEYFPGCMKTPVYFSRPSKPESVKFVCGDRIGDNSLKIDEPKAFALAIRNDDIVEITITTEETSNGYQYAWKKGSVSHLESFLLKLPGVTGAMVNENDTCEEVDGMPPFSIECIVAGGIKEDIAKTIYCNKSAGVLSLGNISHDVGDEFVERWVSFSRPSKPESVKFVCGDRIGDNSLEIDEPRAFAPSNDYVPLIDVQKYLREHTAERGLNLEVKDSGELSFAIDSKDIK